MKTAHVYILLGGLAGGDPSRAVNEGMYDLADQLERIPGVKVTSYPWAQYESVALDHANKTDDELVVIGYSGGGWKANVLANEHPGLLINLMVLYDPSPAWSMRPIGHNVVRAICFHNTAPMFGNLGGGELHGPPGVVQTIDIAEEHLFVQNDQRLHDQTVAAVKSLLS
jgi:hypothetical protein